MSLVLNNQALIIFFMWPKKKTVLFQVNTWNFKIGTVGMGFFYFVQNFYMEIIGKQYVRMEKLQNPLKMKKDVRAGRKN